MDITPWRPFKDLIPLRKEMDNLFRKFFGELPAPFDAEWLPAVDVSESADAITVRAELPGMEAKDIDVTVLGDLLTIKGEKSKEEEKEGEHYHSSERFYGSFQRSFRIPTVVDMEKVAASFEKGVLKVVLPKTEDARSKEIKVEIK